MQSTGHFTAADWTETPLRPVSPDAGPGAPGLHHATVTNTFTGGIEAVGTRASYSIAYLTETAGTFTGIEVLSGSVEGRDGSFALVQRGSFGADGVLRCTFDVLAGSGTGALTGLRGSGGFTHRHGETSVAYTFDHEWD
ncbi:DUF3224 domain-containing protein [Streptomyces sp. GSL17-111]|uniref:DUF3224 domain-containing protein n=1 Tax=Streptomyces sp. GSL17-111 TaxID=3121596 RepID=UPI0030F45176